MPKKKQNELTGLIRSAVSPKGFAVIVTISLATTVGLFYLVSALAATTYYRKVPNVSAGTKSVCFYYSGPTNATYDMRADAEYGPRVISSKQSYNVGSGRGKVVLGNVPVTKAGYVKTSIVVHSGTFAYDGVSIVPAGRRCPTGPQVR